MRSFVKIKHTRNGVPRCIHIQKLRLLPKIIKKICTFSRNETRCRGHSDLKQHATFQDPIMFPQIEFDIHRTLIPPLHDFYRVLSVKYLFVDGLSCGELSFFLKPRPEVKVKVTQKCKLASDTP